MTLPSNDPSDLRPNPWEEHAARNRALLLLGTLACMLLFWAAARMFGIPAAPGYSASLLQQPNVGVAVIITALVFFASVFVGATFTSRIHREGGLFCACIGLAVLSARGGAMRYVLFYAPGKSVYLMLAGEMLLLGALLAAAWIALDQAQPRGRAGAHDVPFESSEQKYFATIVNVLLMITLMSLLAQTDSKAQVLAAVGASAMLATMAANWFAPVTPSPWVWCGPILVGLIGYVSAYFSRAAGIEIGQTSGYFAALARALPLDYASVGVAGSLMGYWLSSRWHHTEAPARPAPAAESAKSPGA